jgi:excisionase family DNA binding protein
MRKEARSRNTADRFEFIEFAAPRLFSVVDAAKYMGCSAWFLRSLIATGGLPYVKLGKKVRIDRGDIDKFIDLQRITSSA